MYPDEDLDPSVCSLRSVIMDLRTDQVSDDEDMETQLDRLIGLMPNFPDHFIYVYHYGLGRITYHRGFDAVLGYTANEVDIDLLYRIFHPEDAPIVARLSEATIRAMARIRDPKSLFGLTLTVDYRMRRKDGRYLKVLRQTAVFQVDRTTGRVMSTFSLCKDISHIKKSSSIGWQIRGEALADVDLSAIEGQVKRMQYHPTPREMELIGHLSDGRASKEIAAMMGISLLTVNTHRRNLLERTGSKNTAELIKRAFDEQWIVPLT